MAGQCERDTLGGRVDAALAGSLPVKSLSAAESAEFDAAVAARIQERVRTTDLGAVLNARGQTTVALDAQGALTEYRPDGTSSSL